MVKYLSASSLGTESPDFYNHEDTKDTKITEMCHSERSEESHWRLPRLPAADSQ
jgi:hypothetical protein